MWNYLKEWWNQPYWGTDFQKYQFARFKSKMIFLLCGLVFHILLISIAELDAICESIEYSPAGTGKMDFWLEDIVDNEIANRK